MWVKQLLLVLHCIFLRGITAGDAATMSGTTGASLLWMALTEPLGGKRGKRRKWQGESFTGTVSALVEQSLQLLTGGFPWHHLQ